MRKFLIASEGYSGEAAAVFNESGQLVTLDVSETDMSLKFSSVLFQKIPSEISAFFEYMNARDNVKCIEASIEITFDMFWEKYNRKINKKRSQPLFNKLSQLRQAACYYGIKQYDRYLDVVNWRTKADPENYLRNEMWDSDWAVLIKEAKNQKR